MKIQYTIELDLEGDQLPVLEFSKLRNALANEIDEAIDYYLQGNNTYEQEFYHLTAHGLTLNKLTIN